MRRTLWNRWKRGIVILILTCTTSGCWNLAEINDVGLIMGMGVDLEQTEEGGEEVTRFRLTSQVLNPGAAKKNAPDSVVIFSTTGKTIYMAERNFIPHAGRMLVWSHNRVIIIGKKAAQQGVAPVLDFFNRDHGSRLDTLIFVTEGKAESIIRAKHPLNKIPALYFEEVMKAMPHSPRAPKVILRDFLMAHSNPAASAYAPIVHITDDSEPHLFVSRTALFQKDKYAGELNERETRGLLWIKGEVKNAIVDLNNPEMSIKILKAKSDIKPVMQRGKLTIQVNIKETGIIGDIINHVDINETTIKQIEQQQNKAIRKEAQSAIQKAQRLQTDAFGFHEKVAAHYPGYWKEVRDNWPQTFAELDVIVEVKTKINGVGLVEQRAE